MIIESAFEYAPRQITYNEILQGMTTQLSDGFYYISLLLFGYVLLNMYVFNENARFRSHFDKLDEYQIESIGSLRDLIFQVIKVFALVGSLTLVMMNIIYRMGLNI